VEKYFIQSLIILTAYGILMNADILLVKHYFDPVQAGLFARAGTIARTVIFVPMPIAMAMFPKVASAGIVEQRDWKTLGLAVLFVAVLVLGAAVACSLLPWLPLWILYGDRHPTAEMSGLVSAMVWAMLPLGLAYLLMNFELAQHRFRAAYWVVLCASGYVIGVVILHRSLWNVPAVLAAMNVLAVVFLVAGLPWRGGRGPAPEMTKAQIS
jgi:O-antigen/teichoic acid export membrane protein